MEKKLLSKTKKESNARYGLAFEYDMGYYRPIQDYNLGKKAEFAERKWFTERAIFKHLNEQAG